MKKYFLFPSTISFIYTVLTLQTVFAQAPVITSFTPVNGAPGTTVTITGTGFNTTNAQNTVFFGAVTAVVAGGSGTQLTVTVPVGAIYSRIIVLNRATGLAAQSNAQFFNPTFSPNQGNITSADLSPKVDVPHSSGVISHMTVAGDLNADGKVDLVSATEDGVVILQNSSTPGNASFSAPIQIGQGNGDIWGVAIGDLDGDEKPDLAVQNLTLDSVMVYLNTATAGDSISLTLSGTFATQSGPIAIAIADFDGDGMLDIVNENFYPETLSILKNNSTVGHIDFEQGAILQIGGGAYSVDVGDLDGDEKPDIVTANYNDGTISVLHNTSTLGSVSFDIQEVFTAWDAYKVAIGDLDGDGKADIAVSKYNDTGKVSVFRNTSTPGTIDLASFASPEEFDAGPGTSSVAIGDINGDGKPDLVTANYSDSGDPAIPYSISVLKNSSSSGNLNFEPNIEFLAGNSPWFAAIADIDGDGKSDIAQVGESADLAVFLNNPQFSPTADLTALSLSSGSLDPVFLAATLNYTASVPNAIASITVTPSLADAAATVKVNGVAVTSGNPSGNINLSLGENTITIVVTTGDGAIEKSYTIVLTRAFLPPVINAFSPLSASPGTTVTISGTGFNATATENAVFFGAVNAIITGGSGTELTVTVPVGVTYSQIIVLNRETGLAAQSNGQFFNPTFSPSKVTFTSDDLSPKVDVPYSSGVISHMTVAGDLNADGQVDLVSATEDGVIILQNSSTPGNVGFSAPIQIDPGNGDIWGVTIGDLDGDGKPDLAVQNIDLDTVRIYLNATTAGNNISFVLQGSFATQSRPIAIAVADLDGDGRLDIVNENFNSQTLSILKNISTVGHINFKQGAVLPIGAEPYSIAVGDLDGDEKPDIVTGNYNDGTISVLHNTSTWGNISFATQFLFTAVGAYNAAIGDLDGDRKPDIAVARYDYAIGKVSVFRNTSTLGHIDLASFASPEEFDAGPGTSSVAIGDINGDGKPDLVTANFADSGDPVIPYSISVLKNSGSSGTLNFEPNIEFLAGNSPWFAAMVDIDGDGKSDIAQVGESVAVAVFLNRPQFSTNADLAALLLSSGSLDPVFSAATVNYTAAVSNAITSITLTPSLADATASVKIDGIEVVSGNASGTINLNVGTNTVTTVVTAQDGTTTKTYTVTVTRAPSANADLSALSLSSGTISPGFEASTVNYSVAIGNSTSSITVISTLADATASVKVNGITVVSGNSSGVINLNVGVNTVTTAVTAQDGTTLKIYTITVSRAPSANADLSALALSSGTLTPAFDAGTINYTAAVSNATTSITVSPSMSDGAASVEINGTGVSNGSASGNINLNVGANIITAVVNSEDGTTTKTYTVTVTRAVKEAAGQTLTFAPITRRMYGDPDFDPGAIATSGLPVTYTSSNLSVAAIIDGKVHLIGTGITAFTATQIGDTNFNPVAATQTLVVDKAPLTIAANSLIRWTGAINPPLEITPRGFVNGETATVLITQPIVSTTAQYTSPAGNYAITVSGATALNYSITYIDGILSVIDPVINIAPTLTAISDQTVCAGSAAQQIALSGITPGPELGQSTVLSISSDNPSMFSQLSVSGNGAVGTITYLLRAGALGIGKVKVTIKDDGGTENGGSDTFVREFLITINPLPLVNINSSAGGSISKGATTILTATGGSTYSWATADGIISGQNTADLTVRPMMNTTYTVTATNTSGCTTVQGFNLEVTDDYTTVERVNAMTPNGDGKNDFFIVKNIDAYPNNNLKIFDRSGRLVYSKDSYRNDWDGTYNGSPLSEGAYFYFVSLDGGKRKLKGIITIVRTK